MLRGCPATSADYIHPALLHELIHYPPHLSGTLVISAELVRKACIWMCRDEERCLLRQLFYIRLELLSPQGTVKPYAQQRVVRHCDEERLEGLPGESASAGIGDCARDHHRQVDSFFLKHSADSEKGSLGIEAVKYR